MLHTTKQCLSKRMQNKMNDNQNFSKSFWAASTQGLPFSQAVRLDLHPTLFFFHLTFSMFTTRGTKWCKTKQTELGAQDTNYMSMPNQLWSFRCIRWAFFDISLRLVIKAAFSNILMDYFSQLNGRRNDTFVYYI